MISSKLIFSWSFTHSITLRACTSVRNRIVVDFCMRTFYLFVWNPDMATQYTLVPSCLGRWSYDAMVGWRRDGTMTHNGTTVRWRWCDDTMTIMRWFDGDEAMLYHTMRLRTIALSIFCIVLFIIHFNDFKINVIECIIWKDNGNLQTYNTLCALILIIKDSSFYCEISMICDFIERSPAAMSKSYTSGNVNKFEGCFPSFAGKPREVTIGRTIASSSSSSHHRHRTIASSYYRPKLDAATVRW